MQLQVIHQNLKQGVGGGLEPDPDPLVYGTPSLPLFQADLSCVISENPAN